MLTTASRRERTHLEDRFAQRALPGIGGVGRTSDPAPDSRPGIWGRIRCTAKLVAGAAPPLVIAAFVAEVLSEACYAGLLGRSVAAASRMGTAPRSRSRRGLGPWFMLRLTV